MLKKAILIGLALVAAGNTPVAAKPKAMIERTQNSPTAVISSTVTVPPGSRIVYLSGSTASPLDPAKPEDLGDTKAQTLSILTKMKATLEGMGMTMGDIVKMNVFLVGVPEREGKMDSPAMNEVFKTFFGTPEQPNKPARSTVQVAALGRPYVLVEIEGIAAKAP
ncbi:Rid family hydrolase [Sphingobium sp. DEHP117]|uniref:Rid family hydrolase n=1 Tax=Sphingobium sp. DEHP117 TaxID=2993436 RepID=UPI0027D54AD0|nr:Rid family hydrolase [Sphingobium sp. DEHP117]MDQ4420954.1 Rid family hydrolase [Sphingobium sp. DEHP117]